MKKTNNLNINICEYLKSNYPNWMKDFPEIYQLDENFNIIREWKNKKEIISYFGKKIQGLDLALRNSCRFLGYFWVIKILYDKLGIRPLKLVKRNDLIYAYNPSKDILNKYYSYEDINTEDFYKKGIKEKFSFIGRFRNSVDVSKFLDLSITNIRRVAKKDPEIIFHKDYWFSFTPLLDIHKIEADTIDLLNLKKERFLREEDKQKLISNILYLKENFYQDNREIGFIEEDLWDKINNIDIENLKKI